MPRSGDGRQKTCEIALAAHILSIPLHHHDPFDSILTAQALVEALTLVTRDAEIQKYEVALRVV
jgi:PIN domain nuclease of toxin-antitoxin system